MDFQKLFNEMMQGNCETEPYFKQMQPKYKSLRNAQNAGSLSDAELADLWNAEDSVMGGKIRRDSFRSCSKLMSPQRACWSSLKNVANDPTEANLDALIEAVRAEYGQNYWARAHRFISYFNNDLFNIYSCGKMNLFLQKLVDEGYLSQNAFKKSDSWYKKSLLAMNTVRQNLQIPSNLTGVDQDYRLKTFAWIIAEKYLA